MKEINFIDSNHQISKHQKNSERANNLNFIHSKIRRKHSWEKKKKKKKKNKSIPQKEIDCVPIKGRKKYLSMRLVDIYSFLIFYS